MGWVLTQHVQLGSSRAEACLGSLTFVGRLILYLYGPNVEVVLATGCIP